MSGDRVQSVRGRFWLPQLEEQVSVGTFCFAPGESVELDLAPALPQGATSLGHIQEHVAMVHGVLEAPLTGVRATSPKEISLSDCRARGWTIDTLLPGKQPSAITLRPRIALVGGLFPMAPRSDSVRVSFDRLGEWFVDSGLSYDFADEPDPHRTVKWTPPAPLEFALPGLSLTIYVSLPSFRASRGPSAQLETVCSARLTSGWPASIGEWRRDIGALQSFLAFAVGERVWRTDVALRLPTTPPSAERAPVVDITAIETMAGSERWRPDRHFLPREHIAGREQEILSRWWELSTRLGIVLDSLILATCRTTSYSPQAFLELAATGEAYHAMAGPPWQQPADLKAAVGRVKKELKVLVPEEALRERFHPPIDAVLGPTFPERLDSLVVRVGAPLRDLLEWRADTTIAATELRNFLAHGMSKRKQPAALHDPQEFIDLVKKLQALLKANILLDLGLSLAETTALLERSNGPGRWFS